MKKRVKLKILTRAILLIGFIAMWIILYHYTDLFQYFTKDKISTTIDTIRKFVGSFGILGPILFVVIGSVAMLINLPIVYIICLSVVTFGNITGAIASFIILCIGTALIYFFAQFLGKPLVEELFENKLKKIQERLKEKGLVTVLYLRLAFFMWPPMNWLLCTTNISFRDLFLGTLIGTSHHIILTVWLTGLIVETIKAGQSLNPINTPKLLLPIFLAIIIFLVAKIVDRLATR